MIEIKIEINDDGEIRLYGSETKSTTEKLRELGDEIFIGAAGVIEEALIEKPDTVTSMGSDDFDKYFSVTNGYFGLDDISKIYH